MVAVAPAGERDQETRVGYAFREREKPFRAERPGGAETQPARRMNGFPWEARALSNWS
jgi:hypothetical protein